MMVEMRPSVRISHRSYSKVRCVVFKNHQSLSTPGITMKSRNAFHFQMGNREFQRKIRGFRCFSSKAEKYDNPEDSLILSKAQDNRRRQQQLIPWYKRKSYYFFFMFGCGLLFVYFIEKKAQYKLWFQLILPAIKREKKYPFQDGFDLENFNTNSLNPSQYFSAYWSLAFLVVFMSQSPEARVVLAQLDGIKQIADWSQSTTDEDEIWYAMNSFCLFADDSKSRKMLCDTEGIVPYIMKLTSSTNFEISQLAMQVLYLCMSEEKFKDKFLKNDGVHFLLNWARSQNDMAYFSMNLLGIFFISHKDLLQSIKKTLSDDEKHVIFQSLNHLSETYNQAGEHKLALEGHQQSLVVLYRGTGYRAQVLTQIAVQLKKLNRLEEASNYFEKSLSSNPHQIETAYNLASEMYKKSDNDKTLEKVAEIMDLGLDELKQPKHPGMPHPHPLAAKGYALIVKAYERLGKLELALDKAEEWALECDSNPNAHFNVGCLLTKLEYYDEALNALGHAIRLRPDRIQAYKTKGQCLYKMGDIDQAVKSYHEAVQLAKDSAQDDILTLLYHEYGGLLYKCQRWHEAFEVFTQQSQLHNQSGFVEKYSNNSKIRNINPNYKLACCLDKLGKFNEAYAAYTSALDHPNPGLLKIVGERCKRSPSDVKSDHRVNWRAMCSKSLEYNV